MKIHRYFLLIAIVLVSQISTQTLLSLPVSKELLVKLSLSMQKLEGVLSNFGSRYENKFEIYKRTQLTKKYLLELNKALCQYNNVIVGTGNSVNGNKNIVIGNYDNIKGSNNWVFVSSFTGNITGDLLLGQWRLQMDKSNLILINPRLAISFIDEQKNIEMNRRYAGKNRELCRWDKWTNPSSKRSDQHWQKFKGYSDWKTNTWSKTISSFTNNLWGSNNYWGGSSSGSWGSWGSWGGLWGR